MIDGENSHFSFFLVWTCLLSSLLLDLVGVRGFFLFSSHLALVWNACFYDNNVIFFFFFGWNVRRFVVLIWVFVLNQRSPCYVRKREVCTIKLWVLIEGNADFVLEISIEGNVWMCFLLCLLSEALNSKSQLQTSSRIK